MTQLVERLDDDGLAMLTLNRPDKLNALTVDLFRQLRVHTHGHTGTGCGAGLQA